MVLTPLSQAALRMGRAWTTFSKKAEVKKQTCLVFTQRPALRANALIRLQIGCQAQILTIHFTEPKPAPPSYSGGFLSEFHQSNDHIKLTIGTDTFSPHFPRERYSTFCVDILVCVRRASWGRLH